VSLRINLENEWCEKYGRAKQWPEQLYRSVVNASGELPVGHNTGSLKRRSEWLERSKIEWDDIHVTNAVPFLAEEGDS
jgi:hypothetical protein